MRKFFLLAILAISLITSISAQDAPTAPSTTSNIRGLGARVLFIDHGHPNSIDSLDITNGLELSYLHGFSKSLALEVPVKLGVINVPGDINNRNLLSIDALLRYQFNTGKALLPNIFGGVGYSIEKFEEGNLQIPLGLGINYMVGQNSYISLKGEYRISMEENRNNIQLGLGYIYNLTRKDADHDGIADEDDQCPYVFGTKEMNGCPDSDMDGIADNEDKCPKVAGGKETMGCPDKDGDGVIDSMDQCPDTPGTIEGCPDTDGDGYMDIIDDCPEIAGAVDGCPDKDGDGVIDSIDKCPDVPGTMMGCPDTDGDGVSDDIDECPNEAGMLKGCPDTDKDGIANNKDSCPNQAGPESNKGCPEIKEEVKKVLEFAMSAVQFETGKADLKPESYSVLDQIVTILNDYPGYKINISGHTDDRGAEDANQLLSENRAKSCYDYIASKGIKATRLSYAGYGETLPIADNATLQGRRLNRRVEFNLYIE